MVESWTDRVQKISNFYNNLIDQHGQSLEACDYGHPESQAIRFEILSQAIPLNGKKVLDVGCGFAAFADYLFSKYERVSYEGIDITPKMIETAKVLHKNLPLKVLDLFNEDPGGTYDLVVANGLFYLFGDNADFLMKQLIKRMYTFCSEALAFSSLSVYAKTKEAGEFYADPMQVFEYCKTLTPWVVLRHDYLPHDFMIYMYKNSQNK
ncbi:class I SAM-dependent methyltransferase [Moorena producens]|uniref:class I SAM-dependent methyltransferase n=1 Tax=Moorena producens TaxID=1155739 RepID=UPI003C728329